MSGPVTINYYGRLDDNQVESTIIKASRILPDIKVNYVELPDSPTTACHISSTQCFQAGTPPSTCSPGDVVWPPIFASAGWVIPFDEYIAGELTICRDR